MTTKQWLEKWLRIYVKNNVRFRTYQKYEQIIRTHIVPKLGAIEVNELNELKTIDIQEFIADNLTEEKQLSGSTVNVVIAVLKEAFSTAEDLEIVEKNPAKKLKRMPTEEKEIDAFSRKEQQTMERYILDEKRTKLYGIVICLYTGMRIGELVALEWADVDFRQKILRVNKTFSPNDKTPKTKTKSSVRDIPVSEVIFPFLKELKEKSTCQYVLEYKGKQIKMRSLQATFKRLVHKLGIRELSFHALRHTFATRAIESGADCKTVASLMGHSNAMITVNRYVHSMMDTKRKAIKMLSKSV